MKPETTDKIQRLKKLLSLTELFPRYDTRDKDSRQVQFLDELRTIRTRFAIELSGKEFKDEIEDAVRRYLYKFESFISANDKEGWKSYKKNWRYYFDARIAEPLTLPGPWENLVTKAFGITSNFFEPDIKTRTPAEQLLQRAGVREGLEDYVKKIAEKAKRILDLEGGYGSVGIVDLGNGEVVKIGKAAQIQKEREVYKLLKGTDSGKFLPEYQDEAHNEEIGLIRLRRYKTHKFDALLRNPSRKTIDDYVNYNLRLMAQFHTDLTRRAKEKGIEFTTEQNYNSNSNPDLGLITDPLENERLFRYFRETQPSNKAIDYAEKTAEEVKGIIAEESDCLIHGDWKPENLEYGNIYDFSDVRKGNELEDIMRFLASYFVQATKEQARSIVNSYIEYRAEVDKDFSPEKQEKLRKYADKFYDFEISLYALRSNKRDLRIPEKRAERIYYIGNMQKAA